MYFLLLLGFISIAENSNPCFVFKSSLFVLFSSSGISLSSKGTDFPLYALFSTILIPDIYPAMQPATIPVPVKSLREIFILI